MKNIYHILRQAVLVLSVLCFAVSGGVLAQNNNWQQQQQQQQQQRQQEESRRQQDQMRQQQQQQQQQLQAQQQQQEQARRQQEENRRQQDQMRQQQAQQQQEQTRRQQEQARLQQQQYQQQQEQARRLQDENRRQAEASKRDLQAAQTKNEQEKQRQQIQNAQKAQMAGKPAPAGTPQTIANRASDRMVFSNGDAKLTRPLTPAEMKRGFTGKVTADGRALVKFQNRIFAVPAARLGITPRDTSTSPAALATSWSPQKQSAIDADIRKLAAGASPSPGTAAKGEPVKVASVPTSSRTDAARAARSGGGGGGQEPPATKDLTPKSDGGSVAEKGGADVGRAGKQARLRELANDPKLGSADRGWINQEMNSIERGQRSSIRNPPGKDLAHERGREAAKGYDYSHSNLQDRDLHRLQHKYDDFGRANAERPLP